MAKEFHSLSNAQTIKALKSSMNGLSSSEVQKRLATFGKNEIPSEAGRSLFQMLLGQVSDFMIIILIFAAVTAGVMGEMADSIAILVIIIINAIVGVVQEYKAEEALGALKKMSNPLAMVKRERTWKAIDSLELVPGDLVKVEAGNYLAADLRIIESASLKIEEAALTGESVPVDKQSKEIPVDTVLAERTNMLYKGTIVTYGHGLGVVTATGLNTEFGKIAKLLKEEKRSKTPLQKRLEKFGKKLTWFLLAVCLVVFLIGMYRGGTWLEMLMTSVSLAVAAIPEALPAVLTISLALGARTLVKQNALIQRLPAVETLGTVTYICSDKTGTLTQNKMHVDEVWSPQHTDLIQGMFLNNDTERGANNSLIGDPTETSMYEYSLTKLGDERLKTDMARVGEVPFDSDIKRMTTVHKDGEGYRVIVKGALESVLPLCSDSVEEIEEKAHKMATSGLRVLAFAQKHTPECGREESWCKDLMFLGLVGLIDPPREESAQAVAECKAAGITPLMITGDHPITAMAIALRIGIIENDHEEVITGKRLDTYSDEKLIEKLKTVRVFSRATPEQKIRIVKILQDQGEYVAMTGDGVNDAPSLKRADIGIAMGITGTDVARKAAHMTLLDDNFATIVKAIREGRRIFDNIKKFIKFALIGNTGEVLTVFLAPFFSLKIPLLPIHILWVNLVTDGLPGLAFSKEPEEEGIMSRLPRSGKEGIFDRKFIRQILMYGTLIAGVTLIGYKLGVNVSEAHGQTMAFTILTFSQMILVLEIRRRRESLYSKSLFTNPSMLLAIALSLAIHLVILYVPSAQKFMKAVALDGNQILTSIGLISIIGVVIEVEKLIARMRSS